MAKKDAGTCISTGVASRAKAVTVPLNSAQARPHLKSYVHFWAPHLKKAIEGLEQPEKKGTEAA